MTDYARTYFHTAFFSFIYLILFTIVVPGFAPKKKKNRKKAFHNGFAPVLLDSAYSNTLSAEPKLFPQDNRNLLDNSAYNSETYCSCSSVSQARNYFTETTTVLKTDLCQRPNVGVCLQLTSPLWSFPHFSHSSYHRSLQSTFPCAGGNPFPASSLQSVQPAARCVTWTEHARQPALAC